MEGCSFRKYELELRLLEAVERLLSTQRVKTTMKDAAFDGQAGTTQEFNDFTHSNNQIIEIFFNSLIN